MDLQDTDGIESEKFVIFQQNDLHIESFPLMKEIRRQGKLCDVTLKVRINQRMVLLIQCDFISCFLLTKVEDQSFSAHRIVLAATIPYFYAMFTHDMAESRVKEITMKEIDPQ